MSKPLSPGILLMMSLGAVSRAAPPEPDFILDFSDEFEGTEIKTGDWDYREGRIWQGYGSRDNVKAQDGKLRIDLKKENAGGMPFTSGGLMSRRRFGYGYYETLCKLTDIPGWHNSFWVHSSYNELDIFEVDSYRPSNVESNLHYWYQGNTLWGGGVKRPTGINAADGYHLFGMEWTPSLLRFWVDGKLYREDFYPGPHIPGRVMLTSVAMGKPDTNNIQGPAAIFFEYFRYYRKSYLPAIPPGAVSIGPGTAGYSESGGAWSSDAMAIGHAGAGTSRVSKNAAARARWAPTLPKAGRYEVFAWNPSFFMDYRVAYQHYFIQGITTASVKYSVTHAGGSSAVGLDPSKAGQGWVRLGAFDLPAQGAAITLEAGAGAVARADAMAFIPADNTSGLRDFQTSDFPGRTAPWKPGILLRPGNVIHAPGKVFDAKGRRHEVKGPSGMSQGPSPRRD